MNRIPHFDIQTTTSWLPFILNHSKNQFEWLEQLPVSNKKWSGGKFKVKRRGVGIPIPKKNMGWVIYGSKQCSFCVNAKTWFDYRQIPVHYYDIDELIENKFIQDREDLFKRLGEDRIKDQKTIPIIFYKRELIGGYTDLLIYAKNNQIN